MPKPNVVGVRALPMGKTIDIHPLEFDYSWRIVWSKRVQVAVGRNLESERRDSDSARTEIVEGLWARLRNVLIALDRVDRLATTTGFEGWIEAFQREDAQMDATAREWVLRAMRIACDPLNYKILRAIQSADGTRVAQVMEQTRMARVELAERVKDLAQVGLVAQDLETESVQATRAGAGVIALMEELSAGVLARLREGRMK